MNHEFKLIFDLYDEEDIKVEGEEPKLVLVKKDCTKMWLADLNNITDCREVISRTGRILKNRCELFNKFENRWLTVKESYSNTKEILNKVENRVVIKGYKNE